MAIAVTESGKNGIPNPHAMNIAGKTYHARDLEDMAQVISNNWTRGVRSIDVGCRSEEHTSELQSLMRISYAVFCLKKKIKTIDNNTESTINNTKYIATTATT